jgi:hypothetical protein
VKLFERESLADVVVVMRLLEVGHVTNIRVGMLAAVVKHKLQGPLGLESCLYC